MRLAWSLSRSVVARSRRSILSVMRRSMAWRSARSHSRRPFCSMDHTLSRWKGMKNAPLHGASNPKGINKEPKKSAIPRRSFGGRTMDVSIVIVSYNARDYLRECLRSIEATTPTSLQYEVIVVDNASTDGAPDMVAVEFPWVQLILNTANVGFAKANNQGIAASSGRYVLLLNPDTVVLAGALAAL